MTIAHHPEESLLIAYAAGTLDAGTHMVIATHLGTCLQCRAFAQGMEAAGGDLLDTLPASGMGEGAFARLAARLDEAEPVAAPPATGELIDAPGLPPYVRRLKAGKWRRVAPGIRLQPLTPPAAGEARVFLLRAEPGMRLLAHGHSGVELTCVLKGSFSHAGGRYAAGDFDCGDDSGDHAIAIGEECECLCLVALTGKLQFRGLAGRLVQPFIAI